VVLLHALHSLAPAHDLDLTVLHLNHGLRGPESDADEAFVRDLGVSLHLPFHAERLAPGSLTGNIEQAARDARRAFFRRAMAAVPLDRVATGHSVRDQAETVLFRLLRGAGPTGLRAILPVTAEGIIRPLLDFSRDEIEQFARDHNLNWREDSSNATLVYARNRLRHHLLPELRRDWNPALDQALAQTAFLAAEDEEFWDAEVARVYSNAVHSTPPQAVVLSAPVLQASAPALRRRLIRHAIRNVIGDLNSFTFNHIQSVVDLLQHPAGAIRLPGLEARRSFHYLRIGSPRPHPQYEFPLQVPSVVQIAEKTVHLSLEGYNSGETRGVALDWDKLEQPLTLRNWRPGDRYQPAGSSGVKKLHDLFQVGKVPYWDRPGWPMMISNGAIVWASQFGPAAALQAGRGTRFALRISEDFPGL
jgi:tRNA(Ile)-lysidine synthase